MAKNKRAMKVTNRQREIMVDFMEMHPELVSGRFTATFTKQVHDRLWDELNQQLNSEGIGAVKDVLKWKKCWTSWKSDTKSKVASGKKKKTGGGEREDVDLTPLEIRLATIIGNVVIEGDPAINEAGVPQEHAHHSEASPTPRANIIVESSTSTGNSTVIDNQATETISTKAFESPLPKMSSCIHSMASKSTQIASHKNMATSSCSATASTSAIQPNVEYVLPGYENIGDFSFVEPIIEEVDDTTIPKSGEKTPNIPSEMNRKESYTKKASLTDKKKRKYAEEKSHLEKATEALREIKESKVDALQKMKQSKVEALKSIEKALLKRVEVEEEKCRLEQEKLRVEQSKAQAWKDVASALTNISTYVSSIVSDKTL